MMDAAELVTMRLPALTVQRQPTAGAGAGGRRVTVRFDEPIVLETPVGGAARQLAARVDAAAVGGPDLRAPDVLSTTLAESAALAAEKKAEQRAAAAAAAAGAAPAAAAKSVGRMLGALGVRGVGGPFFVARGSAGAGTSGAAAAGAPPQQLVGLARCVQCCLPQPAKPDRLTC